MAFTAVFATSFIMGWKAEYHIKKFQYLQHTGKFCVLYEKELPHSLEHSQIRSEQRLRKQHANVHDNTVRIIGHEIPTKTNIYICGIFRFLPLQSVVAPTNPRLSSTYKVSHNKQQQQQQQHRRTRRHRWRSHQLTAGAATSPVSLIFHLFGTEPSPASAGSVSSVPGFDPIIKRRDWSVRCLPRPRLTMTNSSFYSRKRLWAGGENEVSWALERSPATQKYINIFHMFVIM